MEQVLGAVSFIVLVLGFAGYYAWERYLEHKEKLALLKKDEE